MASVEDRDFTAGVYGPDLVGLVLREQHLKKR